MTNCYWYTYIHAIYIYAYYTHLFLVLFEYESIVIWKSIDYWKLANLPDYTEYGALGRRPYGRYGIVKELFFVLPRPIRFNSTRPNLPAIKLSTNIYPTFSQIHKPSPTPAKS